MDEPAAAGLAEAREVLIAWWRTREEMRHATLTCGWTPVDSVGFYTDDDRKVIWCPACACRHAARVIPLPTSEVSPRA